MSGHFGNFQQKNTPDKLMIFNLTCDIYNKAKGGSYLSLLPICGIYQSTVFLNLARRYRYNFNNFGKFRFWQEILTFTTTWY
jgi:hypothetical protein